MQSAKLIAAPPTVRVPLRPDDRASTMVHGSHVSSTRSNGSRIVSKSRTLCTFVMLKAVPMSGGPCSVFRRRSVTIATPVARKPAFPPAVPGIPNSPKRAPSIKPVLSIPTRPVVRC